jgi:hypothetical protein
LGELSRVDATAHMSEVQWTSTPCIDRQGLVD